MMKLSNIFVIFLFAINGFGQDFSLGLKLTPQEQLQGIPLASTPFSGDELPGLFDLSVRMPPAGNQGRQNSCTAWAVAYAYKSYQEKIEENNSYLVGGTINTKAVFSPSFIYNQINNGVDGGSGFPDALNLLSQQGAVKLSEMPYNESDFLTKPNSSHKEKAKRYRIDYWRRVNFIDSKEVKAQIRAGYPVLIGAMIDRGFVNDGNASSGNDYTWNSLKGQALGGHAMIVVGYDDQRNAYKVLNSWGTSWGKDGYCWISYSLFAQVVKEAYVMKDSTNSPDNNPNVVPDPNPNPQPFTPLNANVKVINLQHNLQDPSFGVVMKFMGTVDLPQGIGNKVQVVIRFYLNNGQNGKGSVVGSLSPIFMMPDGSAACGTPKISAQVGNNLPWFAVMPYMVLNVPRGGFVFGTYNFRRTDLIAEPILYIDDFAVSSGQLIPFSVNL